MKNRLVFVMTISLLLNIVTLTFTIRTVRASGTIYIRADGSVDPPTASIQRNDDVYVLTDNITSDVNGIIIERGNLTLDGAGYVLQGSGAGDYSARTNGTYLVGRTNVTIKNLRVRNFAGGLMLDEASTCTLRDNVFEKCGAGIWLASSPNNTIIENQLNASDIYFWPASSDNHIIGNNITGECHGIRIFSSERNHIYNNTLTNCRYGLQLLWGSDYSVSNNTFSSCGLQVRGPSENVIENNSVNGKPLVYLEDASDHTVEDAGQVILVNCNNIRVENLSLSDTSYPVQLWGANNTKILNNNITANNWHGVELWYSSNTTMEQNKIAGNLRGVLFQFSSHNTLRENDISDNYFSFFVDGSDLSHFCHDVDVSNTVNSKPMYYWINRNKTSVPLEAGYVALVNCSQMTVQNLTFTRNAQAVLLAFTTNSTVTRNNFSENEHDIYLYQSQKNNVSRNIMATDWYGVYLRKSSNNTIQDNMITSINYYGVMAIDASHNFIVNNTIAAWYGIWFESSSDNLIYHNYFVGATTHQFFTTNSTNVWDDGYPSGGNYWSNYNGTDIYSGHYQNETGYDRIGDTPYILDPDNTDHYPLMTTRMPWDITGSNRWVPDGKCNMRDVGLVASYFGSELGDGKYDVRADITGPTYLIRDGRIDMRDIALVARHFGETY